MGSFLTLILLYFGFSLSSCSHFPLRTYHYVDIKLNWADAQRYCREKYTDLATIETQDDISRLPPNVLGTAAWIGLNDDPKSWKESMGNDLNSWRSSATGETSKTGYSNWAASQPVGSLKDENCVAMGTDGKWEDFNCETKVFTFMCYTVTNGNEKTYEYISTTKTWPAARDYCREHHTDLPMIESQEENDEIVLMKPADSNVWIGLYRVRWTWSDGSQSSFKFWLSGEPNYSGTDEVCVSETVDHKMVDNRCSAELPFLCHQVSKKVVTRLKMKFETDADLTDPATNIQILQQLEAELRSQGWTDFKLRWTIPPKKQEEEKDAEPQCILHN